MRAKDPRRRFRRRERAALLLAADGHCCECDAVLEPDFHADHRDPWARGGVTDVVNGQALCPTCNLHKGASQTVTRAPSPTGPIQAACSTPGVPGPDCAPRNPSAPEPEPAVAGSAQAPECHEELRCAPTSHTLTKSPAA